MAIRIPSSFKEFYLLLPLLINQSTMDIANIASAKPNVILIIILSRPSKFLMLTIFFTTFSNIFYHRHYEENWNIVHNKGLNL